VETHLGYSFDEALIQPQKVTVDSHWRLRGLTTTVVISHTQRAWGSQSGVHAHSGKRAREALNTIRQYTEGNLYVAIDLTGISISECQAAASSFGLAGGQQGDMKRDNTNIGLELTLHESA
jgi:hypothetical protein